MTMNPRTSGRLWRMLGVVALCAVTACTPIFRNHGYVPTEDQLSVVAVGVDARESVQAAIGTPTAGGVLNDQGFYYVSSRFRHFGYLQPEEISREVLAISFDEDGLVSNIERFGLEGGQVVALSRRVTDDNLPDTTFLRQLFGNIGNFDAGALFGEGI